MLGVWGKQQEVVAGNLTVFAKSQILPSTPLAPRQISLCRKRSDPAAGFLE